MLLEEMQSLGEDSVDRAKVGQHCHLYQQAGGLMAVTTTAAKSTA